MDRDEKVRGPAVPVETAAKICGCSPEEVRRWRKQVLPRPPGAVGDVEMFGVSEVLAMAAGVVAKTWHIRANLDQLVARLALKDGNQRGVRIPKGHPYRTDAFHAQRVGDEEGGFLRSRAVLPDL